MQPEFTQQVSADGWLISAQIPGLSAGDLEVTVEHGKRLRVVGKQGDRLREFESILDLPPGFDASQAKAEYFAGELRITLPKV